MSFSRFTKEWASSGPKDVPTDAEAAQGYDYMGPAPPTVQQFNAVNAWLDGKDNWLFNQMREVMTPAGLAPSADIMTTLRDAIRFMVNRGGLVGEIKAIAMNAIPPGYLPCDGRLVSRTAFPALFAAIGTSWGSGDGVTNFALPDYRGRAIVGADQMAGGGARANRLTTASGTAGLFAAMGGSQFLQSHDHGFSQTPHGHTASMSVDGFHAHDGVTTAGGWHTHSAWTDAQGAHNHQLNTSGVRFNTDFSIDPVEGTMHTGFGRIGGGTTTDGLHGHNIGVAGGGEHLHSLVVYGSGSHVHSITLAPSTANISFSASGSGNSQNMPPFAATTVVIFTGVF